jgi:putative transposase
MDQDDQRKASLAELTIAQRELAMARFAVLRSTLEEGVPLSRAAAAAGVPIRTAQRWFARYRGEGLHGLVRLARSDTGARKLNDEVIGLIEGMALHRPRPSVTGIYRRIVTLAKERNWRPPSVSTVYSVVRGLDPAMVTLAHEGTAAYRDRFELIHRHRGDRPNAIWQTDHTELDILVLEATGRTARPWLTVVIDDHSRAIAGYTVFLGAPSALQTSLALRQAIWRKQDPAWPVCGIPDVLYVDHGSDFTSIHLEQVAADLRFQIVYSAVARPQGRGKVERLFGTLNTELLPELPGHLIRGKPATPPRLSLPELDTAIGAFLVGHYNLRTHGEIGAAPRTSWLADGWLPRMPDHLEDLDELLVMVAKTRMVQRDGIRFQGLRYLDPTLASYVGEHVTVRYDPRDITEIRVFHRNRFLCRAIDPDHAGQTITLQDIQTARRARRRSLRSQINERITRVVDFLPDHVRSVLPSASPAAASSKLRRRSKLRTYEVGD